MDLFSEEMNVAVLSLPTQWAFSEGTGTVAGWGKTSEKILLYYREVRDLGRGVLPDVLVQDPGIDFSKPHTIL